MVKQCLQERVDVQLSCPIAAPCTARVLAPLMAVAAFHALLDIRTERNPERIETLLDPYLGCKRRIFRVLTAHRTISIGQALSTPPGASIAKIALALRLLTLLGLLRHAAERGFEGRPLLR